MRLIPTFLLIVAAVGWSFFCGYQACLRSHPEVIERVIYEIPNRETSPPSESQRGGIGVVR